MAATRPSIEMTPSGLVIVSGYLTTTTESWDATVVGMDLDGEEQWRWSPDDPLQTHDEAMALALDPAAEQVVVGGYVTQLDRDAFLARLDVADGSPVWMRTYPEVYIQVSGRATPPSDRPPPRKPQGSTVIDPGANLDREDHRRYNAALTSTLATRLRD